VLTLSQQLFPWPADDATSLSLERSQLSLESQHFSVLDEVQTLKLDVLKAYYAALESQAQEQIAELDLKYAEEYLTIVRHKYEQGAAGQLDSLDAKAKYTSAEYALLESKGTRNRAMSSLKDLIGMSPWQEINVQECSLEYSSPTISIPQAQQEALDNNTAIQQQQLAIEQQQLGLIGEKSKYSPSLDVSLGYTFSGPGSVSNKYEAALALSIPLCNEKSRQAAIGIATQQLKQAELTMEKLKRELASEIRGYILDLQETQKELEYLEQTQEQQCTALGIIQEMFRAGGATALDVLEREIACAKGKMQYLSKIKEYELQRAKLYKSMGRELDI
jgi:outer membrane protein TolC